MEYEIHERRTKIKTKNITLKQTPETDEALKLLSQVKEYLLNVIVILGVCFGVSLLFFFVSILYNRTFSIGFIILILFTAVGFGVAFFVYLNKRSSMLRPYYELLRVAQRNDEIRHEERIRWRERTRLNSEEKALPNLKLKQISNEKLNKIEDAEIQHLQNIEKETK